VGTSAFFALLRSRARSQKEHDNAKKKSAKKAKVLSEKEKARICAFSPTHRGNPVSEPKTARQGGKQGS
jgi:hypothetical protein